jgi:hypothetical protein
MHIHAVTTPRNWGISLNVAWYLDTKEIGIQFGPFNAFIVLGDE